MDDFERAIIISFNHSGSIDPALKAQASLYCDQVKQSPSIVQLCVERFNASNHEEVQFWCLQTLEEIVKHRYVSVDEQKKVYIRNSLMSILSSEGIEKEVNSHTLRPPFVRNKLAHIFVILLMLEYPSKWPSAFLDLLSFMSKGSMAVDTFCRLFNVLDEEVISLDYPRNAEENTVAVRIKDAMREQCIPQIVRAWYDLVIFYKDMRPDIAAMVLDTLSRYVSWIDINLVANDNFLTVMFELLLSEQQTPVLRGSAVSCFLAIVSKRMDPHAKISLLRKLEIGRFCQLLQGNEVSDFVSKLNSFVMGFAEEVLECALKFETNGASEEIKEAASSMLDEVLSSVFYIMQYDEEEDIDSDAVQFLSKYVSKMKNVSKLSDKQLVHISQMLEVIRSRIRYDPKYMEALNIPDVVGKEEEERMHDIRRDFLALFKTICRAAPDITQNFVKNVLVAAVGSSKTSFEDAEASISLFHALAETVNEDTMKSNSSPIAEMIQLLLSSQVPFHSHRIVALIYLETISRYTKFFQHHMEYAPLVLGAYLDHRGIHHPSQSVGGRASYLFMRIVKALRSQLVPFINEILQSLQDTLSIFTQLDVTSRAFNSQLFEDATYTFEAVGLLIGMEEVPVEKQTQYLSALLMPLCQKVNFFLADNSIHNSDVPTAKAACLQWIISAINSLSKGFGERLTTSSRPAIGAMFKETLDILLQVLMALPKIKSLRSKVISFLHRMVDTLGVAVFPYLPKAIEQLLIDSEPKELGDFLVFNNQLICKFKSGMIGIMEEVFPLITSRVFAILPKDGIPSGPGTNTEEIRELHELQRTFFVFLNDLASNELSAVFVIPKSLHYLTQIIDLILQAACSHKDMLVRKVCVQIFIKLIKTWCTGSNEEKVPGFKKFVIEDFSARCCFLSVLDNSFEFRDANTVRGMGSADKVAKESHEKYKLSLFSEIVAAQKVIFEKCGDEFLLQLATNIFPIIGCPQELAEQYCMELKCRDVKDLKSICKSFVERLRMQQNGAILSR